MADDNLNEAVAGVNLDVEESEEEVEDPPVLMREPSTPVIGHIIDELSLLSLGDLEEVRDAIAVILKNKSPPKAYIKWCEERDKFLGIEKPKPFAKTVGELGDVPTYQQWNQWNNPSFGTYKGDRWSLVDGVPTRKGAE
jgi:hypothetical protein